MAIGDKKPVVMKDDKAAPGGVATLDASGNVPFAQLGNVVRKNILRNTNLLNPINQRGQKLYIGAGFTIDGWKNRNAAMETEVTENGLTIRNTSTDSAVFLVQELEQLQTGTYTFSVLVTEFSGDVRMALYNSTGGFAKRAQITEQGVASVTQTIKESDDYRTARIVLMANASVTVTTIGLEPGETQSIAHQDADGKWVRNEITNYGNELMKCQRYYQLFSSEEAIPTNLVDFRPNMRATPATGTIEIDGVTYWFADAEL